MQFKVHDVALILLIVLAAFNSLSAVRLYIGARVVINLREAPINRLSRTRTLCNGLWRRETPSLKPYNRLATPL